MATENYKWIVGTLLVSLVGVSRFVTAAPRATCTEIYGSSGCRTYNSLTGSASYLPSRMGGTSYSPSYSSITVTPARGNNYGSGNGYVLPRASATNGDGSYSGESVYNSRSVRGIGYPGSSAGRSASYGTLSTGGDIGNNAAAVATVAGYSNFANAPPAGPPYNSGSNIGRRGGVGGTSSGAFASGRSSTIAYAGDSTSPSGGVPYGRVDDYGGAAIPSGASRITSGDGAVYGVDARRAVLPYSGAASISSGTDGSTREESVAGVGASQNAAAVSSTSQQPTSSTSTHDDEWIAGLFNMTTPAAATSLADFDPLKEANVECSNAPPFPDSDFAAQDDGTKVYTIPATLPGYSAFFLVGFVKYLRVFNITLLGAAEVDDSKLTHAAKVLAEFLDNDSDGVPDSTDLLKSLNDYKIVFGYVGGSDESDSFWAEKYQNPHNTLFRQHYVCNMHFFEQWASLLSPRYHVRQPKPVTSNVTNSYYNRCSSASSIPFDWSMWNYPFTIAYYGYFEQLPEETKNDINNKMNKATNSGLFVGQYSGDKEMLMAEFLVWSYLTSEGALECHCHNSDIEDVWKSCAAKDLLQFDSNWVKSLDSFKFLPKKLPTGQYSSVAVIPQQEASSPAPPNNTISEVPPPPNFGTVPGSDAHAETIPEDSSNANLGASSDNALPDTSQPAFELLVENISATATDNNAAGTLVEESSLIDTGDTNSIVIGQTPINASAVVGPGAEITVDNQSAFAESLNTNPTTPVYVEAPVETNPEIRMNVAGGVLPTQ